MKRVLHFQSTLRRCYSSTNTGPTGTLFQQAQPREVGPSLLHQTAAIQRTFDARSNSQVLLQTGGAALAKHASFDPHYQRAQSWIRQHAVGPAALSSVLVQGLTTALAEAAFPQAIVLSEQMSYSQSLIVGVPVEARLKVTKVQATAYPLQNAHTTRSDESGFSVTLDTQVVRLRDEAVLAHGERVVWVPDYLHM